MTTLIACAHGTRFAAGRAVVAALVDEVARAAPDVQVLPAFVDVQEPEVDAVVATLAPDEPAVVVPLLLSRGFHTGVDIARAVEGHPGVVASAPLGPHPLLAQVLVARLGELPEIQDAGWLPGDHVVLAAAGSSMPVAVDDVEALAALVRPHVPVPLSIGYAAGASPRIAEAVSAARDGGAARVIALSYVLAPGFFADLVAEAGADLVTAPLGADPRIARIVLERFHAALASAS